MRKLRWTLLILYILLIAGLMAYFWHATDELTIPFLTLLTVISIIIFLSSIGTKDLPMPVRSKRLILPLAMAAFLITILVVTLAFALMELFKIDPTNDDEFAIIFWSLIILNWIFWAILLFWYTKNLDRFIVIKRLAITIFAGSTAELLATIPAHLIVIRRPGCMVGLSTMTAIVAGVCVMIWSFGPGIFLLFIYGRYKEENKWPRCKNCGYDLRGVDHKRCPECGNKVPNKISTIKS